MIQLHQIDPIAFHLGPLQVHWYGIMYLLGFATAWWLGRRRIRAGRLPGVDDQGFGDLLFYGMLGVVLGGRIGYVLFYAFGDFLANPLMLFKVWEGGMSFHGGLLGVAAAVFWWARKRRLHVFDVIDFVAPLVPPGLGLGRLGNYIGGELWGKYTQAGWGVIFRARNRPWRACRQRSCRPSTPVGRWMRWRGIPRSCTRRCWKGWSCSACSGGIRAGRARAMPSPACSR